jgi:hypothetical protein
MRAWASQVSQQESSSDYERRRQHVQQRHSAAAGAIQEESVASPSQLPEPRKLSQTFHSEVHAHCRFQDGDEARSLPELPPKQALQLGLRADQV